MATAIVQNIIDGTRRQQTIVAAAFNCFSDPVERDGFLSANIMPSGRPAQTPLDRAMASDRGLQKALKRMRYFKGYSNP